MMRELRSDASALERRAIEHRTEGQGVMFVASDGKLTGLVVVADPIKDTDVKAIAELHREGSRLVLTGDNPPHRRSGRKAPAAGAALPSKK